MPESMRDTLFRISRLPLLFPLFTFRYRDFKDSPKIIVKKEVKNE